MAVNKDNQVEMRDAYGQALLELGQEYDKMLYLDADLHTSTKALYFKQRYPDRFIQVGIAEQNLFGIAAGLALRRIHSLSFHLCGVCLSTGAGPDCDLYLLSQAQREDTRLVRRHPDQ